MAGTTSRAVTIAAKFLGGDLIKKGADEGAGGIKRLGQEVKKTDETAGKSGSGWTFFSKKTDEAGRSASGAGMHFKGMAKSLLMMGVGIGGGLLALSTIKSSIDSVGEKALEMRQAQSLGIGENSTQTLSILAAYKQRGIGMNMLGMTMKQMAKSSFTAEQQEGKHSKAGARNAESRARQIEMHARAVAKWEAAGSKGAAPLELAKPKELSELGIKAKAYQSLGIVVSQFRKLSGTKQLEEVAEKLTAMPIGPERTRLSTELLGRSANKILPAFEKGEGSAKNMQKYAEGLYKALGLGGATGNMQKFHVESMKMGIASEALKMKLGLVLMPVIMKLMETFRHLYEEISAGKGIWKTVVSSVEKVVAIGKTLIHTVGDVINWFGKHETAAKALMVVLGLLGLAWGVEKVVKFIRALKELWLITKLMSGFRMLAGAITLFGGAETVAAGETIGMSGALVGMQAAAGAILLPLALVAGAIAGIIGVATIASKILGKGSFIDNVKEMLAGHNAAYWERLQGKNEDAGVTMQIGADKKLTAARKAHPHWRWEQ